MSSTLTGLPFAALPLSNADLFYVVQGATGSKQVSGSAFGAIPIIANMSGQLATNIAATGAALSAAISSTGATYGIFTPFNNQPPIVNYATLDTRNSIAMLNFDESTPQSGMFVSSIPYNGSVAGGLIADIKWIAATGAGNCLWGARIMPLNAASNLNIDNFATAATGVTTALTTGLTTTTSLLLSSISGIVRGDSYRLNVYRVANDVNDTLVGLAQVHTIVLRGI